MSKAFEELKQQILTCTACKNLQYDPKPIFQGNENAKIVQISQAPSKTVMEVGKPFFDISGKRLKQEWYEIKDEQFYDPENFYIASIARCYPGKSKTSGDLPPNKQCADRFLHQELAILKPNLFIIIGSYAAKYLFPGESLDTLIFHDQYLCGVLSVVLPHPSPLNRRWLSKHPTFESERLLEIRAHIHRTLNM